MLLYVKLGNENPAHFSVDYAKTLSLTLDLKKQSDNYFFRNIGLCVNR